MKMGGAGLQECHRRSPISHAVRLVSTKAILTSAMPGRHFCHTPGDVGPVVGLVETKIGDMSAITRRRRLAKRRSDGNIKTIKYCRLVAGTSATILRKALWFFLVYRSNQQM